MGLASRPPWITVGDMTRDLHRGFHDPRQTPADDLVRFLEEADRLPGFSPVREAMREAIDPRPGMRLLDAGCGVGLETARLAEDHPDMHVTGVDRNGELLEIARGRSSEVEWVEADLTDLDLASEFDVVRTERVLIHVPDVETVLDNLIGVLAPGGRLALFELDYGGTILAPGADEELADRVAETLYASLEQPQAGRRLPGLLTERGLTDVSATPFSFMPNEQIWQRIVKNTVIAGSPEREVADWLEQQEDAVANGDFVAAFTGVLTAATRP
jgi:ubiquinone/menaquinone biosynthesis C-methylase UbiE